VLTEVRLRDGSLGLTCALIPEDRQRLAEAYDLLSPESKFDRFLTGVPHLSDAMLDRLVDGVDGVDHVALVLVVIDDPGVGTPAGVGRLIRYPDDPTAADVAVNVGEEFRGRGVATALLKELLAQRPVGVETLRTVVSADNRAALAMLRPLGELDIDDAGDRYDVTVVLPPHSPGTGRSAGPRRP